MTRAARGTGILRAVVEYDARTEVRCALELSESSVFVLGDSLPSIGTPVSLQLSFPNAVEPVALSGRAVQVKVLDGPGSACGFVCELDVQSEGTRERLRGLIERLSEKATAEPLRNLRVLLVEDSRLIRDMFAYALQKYFERRPKGVILDQASDVAMAWKQMKEAPYDLVLVDYYLPPDDGGALITRVRNDATLASTPIVAISVGGAKARSASIDAGADLFLDKPLVLKDLFHTLEFLMSQREADATQR